jgi:hypothetical protein
MSAILEWFNNEIKKYVIKITLTGIIFLLDYIKSTQWFKRWGRGGTRQTDRQTNVDLISPTSLFNGTRIKIKFIPEIKHIASSIKNPSV